MTEQQEHLVNLLQQRQTLLSEITELNNQVAAKKELVLRASGAVEYLNQIGIKVPEPEEAPVSEDVTEPTSEAEAEA
tara:strand:+ start:401 stop:631 length:231 start_codon:yes stop_codon:yes gene_type:complete